MKLRNFTSGAGLFASVEDRGAGYLDAGDLGAANSFA
jgi:hypothetical protein